MSEQTQLPAESWANKPKPELKPLSQEIIDKIAARRQELEIKEKNASKGKFFKLLDGQQVEVYFDMADPESRVKPTEVLETDKKTGQSVKVMRDRMNFMLWNDTEQCNQVWAPSPKWEKKIYIAFEDFGPGLVIRRTGKGPSDTDYMFLPPGFKRAM